MPRAERARFVRGSVLLGCAMFAAAVARAGVGSGCSSETGSGLGGSGSSGADSPRSRMLPTSPTTTRGGPNVRPSSGSRCRTAYANASSPTPTTSTEARIDAHVAAVRSDTVRSTTAAV